MESIESNLDRDRERERERERGTMLTRLPRIIHMERHVNSEKIFRSGFNQPRG